VLNAIEPPEARAWLFDNILPFELEVMHARLKYWAGDHMAYLDALYALLHKCKVRARQAGRQAAALAASRAGAGASSKPVEVTEGSAMTSVMWKERGVRICLIMASQLMEMNVGLKSPLLISSFDGIARI
jgi:trafficking protein particle complex subunit 12